MISVIGSVIDRMSTTQTILGAKKNQLISNLERLSATFVQTQAARGRVLDTDYSTEVLMLAKKTNFGCCCFSNDCSSNKTTECVD